MDGETGRVLYGKEAYKGRPNASTTKSHDLHSGAGNGFPETIMYQVSEMPHHSHRHTWECREGQQFYLEDLLYSLMLKKP